ncbi:hypothetical protein QF038_000379 [Pseudarthrobacter sp. W1I19]|nr:hypothetical protein [Pseudarthrobacter sp. W1I19]
MTQVWRGIAMHSDKLPGSYRPAASPSATRYGSNHIDQNA